MEDGALDKVEPGEETPGLGQWLMIFPLSLSSACTWWRREVGGGNMCLLTVSNSQPLRSWHSFWLVQFSESMKHLLKIGSVVLTHTLTYNQMFYFGSIIFSSEYFEKNMIDTPKLIQLRTNNLQSRVVSPWSGSIACNIKFINWITSASDWLFLKANVTLFLFT